MVVENFLENFQKYILPIGSFIFGLVVLSLVRTLIRLQSTKLESESMKKRSLEEKIENLVDELNTNNILIENLRNENYLLKEKIENSDKIINELNKQINYYENLLDKISELVDRIEKQVIRIANRMGVEMNG